MTRSASGAPGGGLYKTTDGGKTWKKLKDGLPTNATGRIGIDWYQKDPKIVYAIIDCENIGKGPPPLPVYLGAVGADIEGKAEITQVLPDSPAAKAGLPSATSLPALATRKSPASICCSMSCARRSRATK